MNTTRTQIPAEVNNFYDRTLLTRVQPLLIHTRFGQVRNIPRKAGTDTIKFRRYSNLSTATDALTEGVTPAGSSLSATNVTATVKQYGDFVTVTDVLSYESKDAVLMEAAEILGDQAGDTFDELTRDILAAGTNVVYSGTSNTATSDVDTGDTITLSDLDEVIAGFKAANAKKITSQVNAGMKTDTSPIRAAYIGIVSPVIGVKIRDLAVTAGTWVPVQKYAQQNDVLPGEIGTFEDIRFVETTNGKVKDSAGASSNDVYCSLFLANYAYGITKINGEALKNIVKPLGSAGTADPLDQRATSGWKGTHVAVILNENFIYRVESAKV